MTTQANSVTIGGKSIQKIFTGTATDGQWNVLKDSVSSSDLGIVMPNQSVNKMTGVYAAGACLFRISSRTTLQQKRFVLGAKSGLVDPSGVDIPALIIHPDDIIESYPKAVNASSNDSEVLAWVHTSKGTEAFSCTTSEDATMTSLTTILTGDEIGESAFGATLLGFTIQCEDGATLNQVQFSTGDGGVPWTAYGTVRDGVGNAYSNMDMSGLNIVIERGSKLQVAVTTA